MVDNSAAREWVIAKAPGSYEYFIARTSFFDDGVRQATLPRLSSSALAMTAGPIGLPITFATRVFSNSTCRPRSNGRERCSSRPASAFRRGRIRTDQLHARPP